MPQPVLYSFRRCPYAMRARLGIAAAGLAVTLREVVLRDKPAEMLEISPKGTVPVLALEDGTVIDESLDIARWALAQKDPERLLAPEGGSLDDMLALIRDNDGPFKHHLDRTKYDTRYPGENPDEHRRQASAFLTTLNNRLENSKYLFGTRLSFADIAIAPFVRQFANIDHDWFEKQPWPHLITWLDAFIESPRFQAIMKKYPQWQPGDDPTIFPPCG